MRTTLRIACFAAAMVGLASATPTAGRSTSPTAIAQINMSHDLVSLGIAGQNLTPDNPALDARPLIQAALDYAQTHAVQVLTVDKGSYFLLSATQGNAVLIFRQLSNMTMDLAGSTIYFSGPLLPNGLVLDRCQSVTLKGFQIDYVTPPYTHVQISSVDTNLRTVSYTTLPGWPDPSTFNGLPVESNWAAFFRNGEIIPGTTRTLLTGPFSGNTLVLTQDTTPWTQAATLSTLQAGDTVVVTARGGGQPILVWEGDGNTLANISIYGSPTWAINLHSVSNTVVEAVRVEPRPGTGLIGSNADGIHFESLRQNNQIRRCYVTRTMDDALAMDNMFAATIVSQLGARQLRVTRNIYLRFPDGTPVRFVDPATTLEIQGPTIISQTPVDSPNPIFNGQVDLTFDQDLPAVAAGMGMTYGSASLRGLGSTIEDNLVEDTYGGKGIWVSGLQGVTVRRNVLRRTSMAAISIHSETLSFPAPPSLDIVVSDNAVEEAGGPAAIGTGAISALGAIAVVFTDDQGLFASASSHSNISIVNNFIADSARSGLWIGEVNGGLLQNNLVIRSNQNPTLGGIFGVPVQFHADVTQDALQPVVIRYSNGVTQTGNTVDQASSVQAPVSFSGASGPAPAAGGQANLDVSTAVTGFAWEATASDAWITITSSTSANGAGTLTYALAPNTTGTARSGTITVAGQTFVIDQATRPEGLLYLDGNDGGDAFVYQPSMGPWVRLLTQLGGGFAQGSGGWAPGWSVWAAEFDNDGLSDLFLSNATNGQWFKMLNTGAGFAVQATSAWWPGWQKFVLDLNGDGLSDLFLYDPATGQWFKCLSTPAGFTYLAGQWSGGWEVTPTRLNDDAFDDLFLINRTTGKWYWVFGQASGGFTYPQTGVWAPDWSFYPGDFNGDGLSDLFLYRQGAGQHYVAMNTGTGYTYTSGSGWAAGWTPTVFDLDANGNADLFLYNKSTGRWFEMLGDGAGHFSAAASGTWGTGWDVYVTDYNADQRSDLLLYNPSTGSWYQAWNYNLGLFGYFGGLGAPGLTIVVGSLVR